MLSGPLADVEVLVPAKAFCGDWRPATGVEAYATGTNGAAPADVGVSKPLTGVELSSLLLLLLLLPEGGAHDAACGCCWYSCGCCCRC